MLILSTDMFALDGGNKMFAILTELLSTLSAAGQYNLLGGHFKFRSLGRLRMGLQVTGLTPVWWFAAPCSVTTPAGLEGLWSNPP